MLMPNMLNALALQTSAIDLICTKYNVNYMSDLKFMLSQQ